MEFLKLVKEKSKILELDPALLNRPVNEGFSGGEKKRNEIFQMAVLEPKLAILDETDSGLDIDALKAVAGGVNKLRRPDNATLVITHYQRLLNYIVPDFVHVLVDGQIVKSGGKELALELEERGYDWVLEERRRRTARHDHRFRPAKDKPGATVPPPASGMRQPRRSRMADVLSAFGRRIRPGPAWLQACAQQAAMAHAGRNRLSHHAKMKNGASRSMAPLLQLPLHPAEAAGAPA